MADLFDALAARALGVAPMLAPALAPRFAPTVDEPELDLDGPPGLTWGAPGETARPVARLTPEPTAPPARPEVRRAHAESALAALVPGQHPPPDQDARPPSRPALPALGRCRETPGEAPRERVPAAPVTVHRQPGRKPAPDRLHQVSEPARARIVATPAPRPAQPAARLDAVPAARARGHQTPAAPVHVTVSIGRVEVRAPAASPAPGPPPQPRRPERRLSLQDYLRREARR
jgi:hypothetical protein